MTQVKVLCQTCLIPEYEPLSYNKNYRISIASWIGNGGNGYGVFKKYRRNFKKGPTSFDVLRNYIQKISPIITMIDGRIKVYQ